MFGYLFLFTVGVILLLISVEYLIRLSSRLRVILKISPLIIGCTVMTVGTTLPELAVSTTAVLKGDFGLATGNILGSNIVNIFLIFGLGILLGHIDIGISKTQKNGFLMLLATILYFWLNSTIISPQTVGIVLICLAGLYLLSEVLMGRYGRCHEDKAFTTKRHDKFTPSLAGKILFSGAGVFLGGLAVVYSVEKISLLSGYSTAFLGFSITAVATSLPELLTILFSRKKDQKKMAIGNILGSNIYNLLFIGGIISLFSDKKIVFGLGGYFLIFSAACGAILIFVYTGRKIPKKIGLVLLFFFFIYILTLK